jgi:hypothetical protein
MQRAVHEHAGRRSLLTERLALTDPQSTSEAESDEQRSDGRTRSTAGAQQRAAGFVERCGQTLSGHSVEPNDGG